MSTRTDVFNVRPSAGSDPENRFAFRCVDGGKVHSVPFLEFLSGESAEYLEKAMEEQHGEVMMTRKLLLIETPATAHAQIRKLANDQVLDISVAWAQASTATDDTDPDDTDADTDSDATGD